MTDLDKLLETTMQILIFRGGPTSGNWAHSGRKGKRGGSGSGGGFKRIGVKNGKKSGRKKIKQSSRQTRVKDERGKKIGGKKQREIEDAIGPTLGPQFSGRLLRKVKELDRDLYDSLKKTGIKNLKNNVDNINATLKFSKARILILEKQKKKAKSAGKTFNPMKVNELRLLSDNITNTESELKHLKNILKGEDQL